ncbi:glycosyltransferase [Tropicimonas aquimaris]|uniref:Glycosyltransferase n=1 Tax=Tropicimonas aquimaris TaxID=914152 RepID=A0ABW3IKR8_9RHOB
MRVLYIPRSSETRKRNRRRFHRALAGYVDGPEGFFEASLHGACSVTRLTLQRALALTKKQRKSFDAVIVNSRSGLEWEDPAAALAALEGFRQPVSFFQSHDRPGAIGDDALLDRFKVIFKREPFDDLSRYDISPANASKIVPTHLSNPMEPMSHRLRWRNRTSAPAEFAWQMPKDQDVFFIGTVSENRYLERMAAWQAVLDSGLPHLGGLLPKKEFAARVPDHLVTTPLPRAEYMKTLMKTRVNLALGGIGPFTFRHLELFWAGAFTLSTPTIREIRFRVPLVDGRDYVAFETPADMIDKIRHYLDHEDERNLIARNGRAAYERLHDVKAHGREIHDALTA